MEAQGALETRAQARVGLLGNPSDLYGGYGLGFAVEQLGVRVRLAPAAEILVEGELVRAAWRLFTREILKDAGDARPWRLDVDGNIPFQAGLSGSSALLIAAVEAWCQWYDRTLDWLGLARFAWRVEAQELATRAGPLDRLVQALGGLLAMDFEDPFAPESIERLDPALLPPCVLAWNPEPGEPSGDVHAPVFARFQAGEPAVHETMQALAAGARAGRDALLQGDTDAFRACIDRNFDLRATLFPIAARDRAMIELGRGLGAATKFCGSGGSVLAVAGEGQDAGDLLAAYEAAGYGALLPRIGG